MKNKEFYAKKEMLKKVDVVKKSHKQYIKDNFFNPMMGTNDKYALYRQNQIIDNFYNRIRYIIKDVKM